MAPKKFTDLTADTSPSSADIVATAESPFGAGSSKKVTLANLFFQMQQWIFGADAGSTDTYVVTLSPAPTGYVTGYHYRFKANTANTGACTVNFNGLGPIAIKKAAGGITTDLADNDIRAGQWVDLVYDGTNMQMQSLLGNSGGGTPGGSNTQVQYNNAGAFAGDAALVWDSGNSILKSGAGFYPQINSSGQLGGSGIQFNKAYANEIIAGAEISRAGGWLLTDAGANGTTSSIFKIRSASGVGVTWGSPRLTPAQITSNQNDYDPGGNAYFVRLSSDASRDITGFSPPTFIDGEVHLWVNIGSQNIVLKHEDANSSAQNRFLNSTGADITLSANQAVDIIRDDGTNRWRVFKRN